jgi:hypothetical protein
LLVGESWSTLAISVDRDQQRRLGHRRRRLRILHRRTLEKRTR